MGGTDRARGVRRGHRGHPLPARLRRAAHVRAGVPSRRRPITRSRRAPCARGWPGTRSARGRTRGWPRTTSGDITARTAAADHPRGGRLVGGHHAPTTVPDAMTIRDGRAPVVQRVDPAARRGGRGRRPCGGARCGGVQRRLLAPGPAGHRHSFPTTIRGRHPMSDERAQFEVLFRDTRGAAAGLPDPPGAGRGRRRPARGGLPRRLAEARGPAAGRGAAAVAVRGRAAPARGAPPATRGQRAEAEAERRRHPVPPDGPTTTAGARPCGTLSSRSATSTANWSPSRPGRA